MISKVDDNENEIVKARLCGQGYSDPDLLQLVRERKTSSPTLSHNGKVAVYQLLASNKFRMSIADVTGAFLVADELNRPMGKIYLRQPSCGLPGLSPDQILEVVKPIYGLNDSPAMWWQKFRDAPLQWSPESGDSGWVQSKLD
eukprot:8382276-Pyramimonas_sp.AAC.1